MKHVRRFALCGMMAYVISLSACKKDDNKTPESKTVYGDAQSLGNGTVRSFIIFDKNGTPQVIGMKFTAEALSGLPTDSTVEHDTPVPLPEEAAITGFNHLELDWNPAGHDPKPIYGLPHFDFHFYMVTKEEQAAVIPGPDTISVPPAFIPQDYVSGVQAVPDMGVHWIDMTAPEFHGQKFTDTFIYGFYHGRMTFMEPMATAAFISSKPDFKIQIKQPLSFQKTGYYPTVQHLYFDASSKEYTMALEGLKFTDGKENN